METIFETQLYHHYKQLWSGDLTSDTTTESVIPDNMPDISAVLDCSAMLFVRSKEIENGRFSVTVDIQAKLLYQAADTPLLQCLPLHTTTTLTTAVPEADSDCLGTANIRVKSSECKIINSRKVSMKTEICGNAACYRRNEWEIAGGIRECNRKIESKMVKTSLVMVSDIREKTFVTTDEFSLPSGIGDVDDIISEEVSLCVDELELAGEKIVFRGRALLFLLLRNGEQLYPCSFESKFSQIMEADAESAPQVSLMLTGAYFDLPERGSGKIGAELHILAQAVCMKTAAIHYMADAYCNQEAIAPRFATHEICTASREIRLRKTLSAAFDSQRNIHEILFSRSSVQSAKIEESTLKLSINTRAVYKNQDGCSVLNHTINEDIPIEREADESIALVNIYCDPIYTTATGGNVSIRLPVDVSLCAQKTQSICSVMDFEKAESACECPSITLLTCHGKEELWDLAKKHHSSVDAILEANEGRTEGLLLIPKCR